MAKIQTLPIKYNVLGLHIGTIAMMINLMIGAICLLSSGVEGLLWYVGPSWLLIVVNIVVALKFASECSRSPFKYFKNSLMIRRPSGACDLLLVSKINAIVAKPFWTVIHMRSGKTHVVSSWLIDQSDLVQMREDAGLPVELEHDAYDFAPESMDDET